MDHELLDSEPDDAIAAAADLRAALQHRDAELERRDELAREVEALIRRAGELLENARLIRSAAESTAAPADPPQDADSDAPAPTDPPASSGNPKPK